MASLQYTIINDTGFVQAPVGTDAQRPGSGVRQTGMLRWNTTQGYMEHWDGAEWKQLGVSGFSGIFYDEGLSAPTANWNNSTTYSMANFGGLGSATAHGFSSGPVTFTLTLNNLPTHTTLRYVVNWHMVDSLDNETSYLDLTDTNGSFVRYFTWTKQYNSSPNFSFIRSGATQTWSGPRSYSYRPWANGAYNADGYSTLDSGYYSHTASSFQARHFMGADQGQSDEAMYLTNVQVWLDS